MQIKNLVNNGCRRLLASGLAFLAPPNSNPEIYPLPDVQQLDDIPAEELICVMPQISFMGWHWPGEGIITGRLRLHSGTSNGKSGSWRTCNPHPCPFPDPPLPDDGSLNACASLCREFLDPIKKRDIRFVYTSGSMKIDLGEVMYRMESSRRG